jgi:hypothetical protein
MEMMSSWRGWNLLPSNGWTVEVHKSLANIIYPIQRESRAKSRRRELRAQTARRGRRGVFFLLGLIGDGSVFSGWSGAGTPGALLS